MEPSLVNGRGVSIFYGQNFQYWKKRMSAYLMSLGLNVQRIVMHGFPPIENDDNLSPNNIKTLELDGKAINALYVALSQKELAKVMGCTTSHEIWEKLITIYEGDSKIKEAKLQVYRSKFESLSMNDDESSSSFEESDEGVNLIALEEISTKKEEEIVASSSYQEELEDDTYPMVVQENFEEEMDAFKEVVEDEAFLRQELELSFKELKLQKKKARKIMKKMEDMQCFIEDSSEEKVLLEERICELEQKLIEMQEGASCDHKFENQVTLLQEEKHMLEYENEVLMEKIEDLTSQLKEQNNMEEEEKATFKEKIIKLEEKVAMLQEEASKLQGNAKDVFSLHKEKEKLECDNEKLLKKVDELSSKLEIQLKSYENMVAKISLQTTPCIAENGSKHIEEVWKKSTFMLKECLERQRPYAMGKQGLGFVESKPTPTLAENSAKVKMVEQRNFVKFHGHCYSCGRVGHFARVCMSRVKLHYGDSFGNGSKCYGKHYNNNHWKQHKARNGGNGFVGKFQSTPSFHCSLTNRFQVLEDYEEDYERECVKCNNFNYHGGAKWKIKTKENPAHAKRSDV